MPIYDESLNAYVTNAAKRQAELDALAAGNKANAASTIAQLQELGVGGAGAPTSVASGTYLNPSSTTVNPLTAHTNFDAATKAAADRAAADAALKESSKPADFNNPPAGTHYVWQVGVGGGGKWVKVNDTVAGGNTGGGGGGGNTSTTDSTAALLAKQAADKAAADAAAEKASRTSAFNILLNEFTKYGLGSLVQDAKDIILQAPSAAEMSIALQNTKAYQQRFAANQDRIKAGLSALTPAEYIGLEDQYQNIMRNYGLPSSYYTKDSLGTQAGFNKFIANDVSAAELEDRIATAQKRVLNADVNVMDALKQFYPDITNGDILAYTLDPTNALENIKRKVTAAEIGGAALQQGLGTNVGRAEELAKYGITKAQAQQGYQAIGEFLPTATALSDIYNKQGLGPYNQATAEAEVFNTADAAAAAQKRKKLSALEQAQFGGQAGTSQGALARERQGSF